MNVDNEEEKKRFQTAICAAWQTFEPKGPVLPLETQRAYFQALIDIPIERVEVAVDLAMKRCKFFPKPVELRILAGYSKEARLQMAWSALLEGVSAYGSFDTVAFADPTLSAAIHQLGGLKHIAQSPQSELHSFLYHRFKDCYLALVDVQGLKAMEFKGGIRRAIVDGETVGTPRRKCIGGSVPKSITENRSPVSGLIEVKRA